MVRLRDLEALVDEYFEASQTDPRRLPVLARDILELCATTGLDADCGIGAGDTEADKLQKLDGYLCELKEMQIRDGLHVFGSAPVDTLRDALLVALARVPRAAGEGGDASLTRAIARDLDLDLDPLNADMAAPWAGERPGILTEQTDDPWRTSGDTVERIELLALKLVGESQDCDAHWPATRAVLDEIEARLAPAVAGSGSC